MMLGMQVGPRGVHVEKDNVFNSQTYAAGAPSITISNDPSAAGSSSGSTPYSGAVAQAPSASTYQNTQSTQPMFTNQAATSSGYGAGTPSPPACLPFNAMH